MPIYENPEVAKYPVVGLGAGDIYICVGKEVEPDGSADRWLLFRGGYEPGSIGLRAETGRADGPLEGSSTAGNPVDFAIHFAAEASVDQVLALLLEIKASFAFDRPAEAPTIEPPPPSSAQALAAEQPFVENPHQLRPSGSGGKSAAAAKPVRRRRPAVGSPPSPPRLSIQEEAWERQDALERFGWVSEGGSE